MADRYMGGEYVGARTEHFCSTPSLEGSSVCGATLSQLRVLRCLTSDVASEVVLNVARKRNIVPWLSDHAGVGTEMKPVNSNHAS